MVWVLAKLQQSCLLHWPRNTAWVCLTMYLQSITQSGFLAPLCIVCCGTACGEALRGSDKVQEPRIGPAGLSLASRHVWGRLDPEKQLDKLAWFGRGGLCNCAALHSEAGEWAGSMSPYLLPSSLCQRLCLQFCAEKNGETLSKKQCFVLATY